MKKEQAYNKSKYWPDTVVFPIGTIVVVGFLFLLSISYTPNWTFNWSGIRPEIRDTVELLQKYGSVTSRIVGYAGTTPQQWYRRRWVMKNATENELIKLKEHPNGVVKVAAYEGLLKRTNLNKYDLLTQALADTITFFNYQSGCVGQPMMLGEYLIENVAHISNRMPPPPPEFIERIELTIEESGILWKLYSEIEDKKQDYFKVKYK